MKQNKPIRILFDACILAQAYYKNGRSAYRGGIYFVAANLLERFVNDKNFDVTLFLQDNRGRQVLHETPSLNHYKVDNAYFTIKQNDVNRFIKNPKFNPNDYDMYFGASMGPHVDFEIQQAHVLYDTIPMMLDFEFYDNGPKWFASYHRQIPSDALGFCISKSARDDFKKFFPHLENLIVAPIATAQEFYPDKDEQKIKQVLKKYSIENNANEKYLFSLCSVDVPRKQILFQIKCFMEMIKKNNIDDLYFYLGGGNFGKNHEILKRELADLFDEDKVRLLGYVADEDVNTLYSNSLFFTYVSLYEGFGMPPLEAMSAGVPVVTSNTSALPEVVGDAAITLDPTDKDAIIKAYEAFYFNPELREECIQKGLERAKMFSWDKMYKIISDKILEVLNDKTKNSNDLGDNRSRRRLLSETSA